MWWQEVLRVANECYQRWLNADPLERLRLLPEAPLSVFEGTLATH